MNFVLRLLLLISFVFLGACASKKYADTRSIRTIAVTQKIHGLKSVGYVKSQDCAWKLLGFSLGTPSYQDAFDKAVSIKKTSFWKGVSDEFSSNTKLDKFKVKLLNNIQTSEDGWNAYLIGKSCIKLKAVAYY